MGSRENYFGWVDLQIIIAILSLRVGTFRNKNIDQRGKETFAYESDHIFFFRHSTMASALNFCFLYILFQS